MSLLLIALTLPPAGFWFAALAAALIAARRVPRLGRVPVPDPPSWPRVSLVSPAKDEAASIEGALQTLLALDYPHLEVVVVDDRSSDGTGEVVRRVAGNDDRVQLLRLDELPEGWLGKVHAMAQGAERATGDWLLFADADAEFGPQVLRRAVAWAEAHDRDFLSLIPRIRSVGGPVDTIFTTSMAVLPIGTRPWTIPDPSSRRVAATGAFLLVRRAALEASPGLAWLRREVSDDFGMCLLIKEHGGSCELLSGADDLAIEWYSSVGEVFDKMQKNFFGIMGGFSVARTAGAGLSMLALGLFPLWALLPGPAPWALAVPAAGLLAMIGTGLVAARWTGLRLLPAVFLPVGLVLIGAVALRSAWEGHRIGGIRWRGTVYRSEDLRDAQHVRL